MTELDVCFFKPEVLSTKLRVLLDCRNDDAADVLSEQYQISGQVVALDGLPPQQPGLYS